jgi:hypothetical protein
MRRRRRRSRIIALFGIGGVFLPLFSFALLCTGMYIENGLKLD